MKKYVIFLVFLFSLSSGFILNAQDLRSKSPDSAKVYFIEPTDGQSISGELTVKFGLTGMGVAPAGVNVENTGHHHLLIDLPGDILPELTQPLPANDHIKHFGKGQTQTTIKLEPGQHSLQLLLGNFLHIPHDKPVLSEKIIVQVK